jgi:transposase
LRTLVQRILPVLHDLSAEFSALKSQQMEAQNSLNKRPPKDRWTSTSALKKAKLQPEVFRFSRIWKVALFGLAYPERRFHMNKPRRHFQDHEKVSILKRHLIDKVPVSDLCDELDLYPNQFYDWSRLPDVRSCHLSILAGATFLTQGHRPFRLQGYSVRLDVSYA